MLGRATSKASSSISYPLQLSSVSQDHALVYQESINNPEQFWGDLGRRRLQWIKEFDQVMDCDMRQGRISWFNGGKINVSGIFMSHFLVSYSCGWGKVYYTTKDYSK